MIEVVRQIWDSELEKVELKSNQKLQEIKLEYENKINSLELEIENLKKSKKEEILKATMIRWDESGEYYNLSDFCRVSKCLLFIKETELKQWLAQQGFLKKENDKYIPSEDNDVCIMIDNELYIKYEYIRNTILLLRSLIFVGDEDDIQDIVDDYKDSKKVIIEQMANTVYVECKQRSVEFREHRENKFFLENK